jgi:PKD domain
MNRHIGAAVLSLLAITTFLPFITCTHGPTAGTGTETENVAAVLYNPGGSTAAFATVHFFKSGSDPRNNSVDSAETDTHGNYAVKLDTGTYNLIAHGDSGMVFRDSIKVLKGETAKPPADTLKVPGSIKGIVQLQPGDDSRTVFILFMGTHTFTLPDDDTGHFTTDYMAAGSYSVRILTTMPNYAVLDTTFTVTAGTENVLAEPIVLQYTGIPTPTGLAVSYDTLNGIAMLKWNKINSLNVSGYIVYRNDSSATLPVEISGNSALSDTFYNDRIFSVDANDTSTLVYQYRIKTQDTNANVGNNFSQPVTLTAVSPAKVRTFMTFSTMNTINDSASINDTVRIIVEYQNRTRQNSDLKWFIDKPDSLLKNKIISGYSGRDTLACSWATAGNHAIYVTVMDADGALWHDSMKVTIILDQPSVSISGDSTVPIDSFRVLTAHVSQRFGSIVKYCWDDGIAPGCDDSTGPSFSARYSSEGAYTVKLEVTDNHGNTSMASRRIIVHNGRPLYLNSNAGFTFLLGPFQGGDTLVSSYSATFPANWVLTDTVNDYYDGTGIDYLDVSAGFAVFNFTNGTQANCGVTGVISNVWNRSFCVQKGIDSITALSASRNDSANYFNGVMSSGTNAVAGGSFQQTLNLSANRMFVEWNDTDKTARAKIQISVNFVGPSGSPVHLSNQDSIVTGLSFTNFSAIDQKGRKWTAMP